MARIRTIKPEFWTDSFMVQLPPIARLVFISLWSCADDHGFILDEPDRLAMEVMPRENAEDFDGWLQFFEAADRIERFVSDDGHHFLRVKNWEKHQRVDRPSKSKISREPSRKVAIPPAVRRGIGEKYGCPPGGNVEASCFYCGAAGEVYWHKTTKGTPSSWVTFPGLEMDHLNCESNGGKNSVENIVLSCRSCNRSKGTKSWIEFFSSVNSDDGSRVFARVHDRNREQGTGNREIITDDDSSASIEVLSQREIVLEAIGVDRSGVLGPTGKIIGTPADMAILNQWMTLPAMSLDQVCAVIREVMAKKRDGPPTTFKYFNRAMQERSGALGLPPLEPIQTKGRTNGISPREQFDVAHREYANRIRNGEIDFGPDPSDPWA